MIEVTFSELPGGKVFSALYLNQAFRQFLITLDTAELLGIDTLKGLYNVKRVPLCVVTTLSIV